MEIDLTFAVLVAITGGITEVIKQAIKKMPSGLLPLIALIVGIASAYFAGISLLAGVICGLTAGGVYSGGKAIIGK
ncbi:MAG: hypothetical protein GY861_18135 [bacterium]|nr:hypothetical protein [bacterium]